MSPVRATGRPLLAIGARTITFDVGSFYVYDEAGKHRGPLAIEDLVGEIRAKRIAEDAWVAPELWFEAAGTSGWQRAADVPEIQRALAARSAGDLRVVEGAFTSNRLGSPEFGATVMMIGSARREPSEG